MTELKRLEQVEDLRQIWKSEPAEFTPWLAEPENMELLSDTLGLSLDGESVEVDAGKFRADIVCIDKDSSAKVVIENQLEEADHKHVGQIITYAAQLDAGIAIWIAKEFSDEHRAALDWLNGKTDPDVRFFGLEIELWQIGECGPAPKFNVVSKPNDWSKSGKTDPPAGNPDHQGFWEKLNDAAKGAGLTQPKPSKRTFAYYGSINAGGFQLRASFSTQKKQLQVALVVNKTYGLAFNQAWQNLSPSQKRDIGDIKWEHRHGSSSILSREKTGVDPMNRDEWTSHVDWFIEALTSIKSALWDEIAGLAPVVEPQPDNEPEDWVEEPDD